MNVAPNGAGLVPATAGSYRFSLPCPSYVERLTQVRWRIVAERHVLNCAQVGTIHGNVAVRFSMQMRVPADVVGKATLTWVLGPPFGFSRSVPVLIRA